MNRLMWSLLGCLLGSGVMLAASQTSPSATEQPADLVRQLGDRSYAVRQAARLKLLQMGRQAEPALRAGLDSSDAEIRSRCRVLLPEALRFERETLLAAFVAGKEDPKNPLPGWERFQKLVGNDKEARELFADFIRQEGDLIEQAQRQPKAVGKLVADKVQTVQRQMYTPNGYGPITLAEVLPLVFVVMDPHVETPPYSISQVFNTFYHPNLKAALKDGTTARKLVVAMVESRTDPNTVNQTLWVVQNLELKECSGLARKILGGKGHTPHIRGQAMMLLVRFGGKEIVKDVEPFLDDKTNLGGTQINNVRLQTQLRDVALAVTIRASGGKLKDYGYDYFEKFGENINNFHAPVYFGFSTEAKREAAFKKWREAQAKKEPEKPSEPMKRDAK